MTISTILGGPAPPHPDHDIIPANTPKMTILPEYFTIPNIRPPAEKPGTTARMDDRTHRIGNTARRGETTADESTVPVTIDMISYLTNITSRRSP